MVIKKQGGGMPTSEEIGRLVNTNQPSQEPLHNNYFDRDEPPEPEGPRGVPFDLAEAQNAELAHLGI